MKDKKLNGANINRATWENDTLRVYFFDGRIVRYSEVPEGIFEGLCSAKSIGQYFNRFIINNYKYRLEKDMKINEKIKLLEHHKDFTVGLWATDRPDMISKENKDKYFFEIEYN